MIDIHNGTITLGSTLKDIIAVLNGEWSESKIQDWKIIKLSDKFCIAVRNVEANKSYVVPIIPTEDTKGVLFLGNGTATGGVVKIGQQGIHSNINGVCIIFYI